jgi:predicted DNA-binding transcriptional regulator AlpA
MSHSDYTLLSVKDLQALFSMSRSSVYRMLERPGFPKPFVLGPTDQKGSSSRWRSDEVRAYIETLPREKSLGE